MNSDFFQWAFLDLDEFRRNLFKNWINLLNKDKNHYFEDFLLYIYIYIPF